MSCSCPPLSTRSLGARQRLSAQSPLFHVRDVRKGPGGLPQWGTGQGCSEGKGAPNREAICHTPPRGIASTDGVRVKVHTFPLAGPEISSSHRLHTCASWGRKGKPEISIHV
jgi:hypothetical protein